MNFRTAEATNVVTVPMNYDRMVKAALDQPDVEFSRIKWWVLIFHVPARGLNRSV